jgi:hypothetical protein
MKTKWFLGIILRIPLLAWERARYQLIAVCFQVIVNPTDLGTIRIRLDQGGYQDWSAFVTDMELMFNNCRTFNHPSQEVARYVYFYTCPKPLYC